MRLAEIGAGASSASILLIAALPNNAVAQYTVQVLHSPAVPSQFSFGWGAGSGQQVGHTNIFLGGPSHALLWNGSASSFVDLHPEGFTASYAFDADGGKQAGWREDASGTSLATMWSGTASTWQNLHNKQFEQTRAHGIGGGQQVGAGIVPPGWSHAVLWQGTPESAVDLHPSGFDYSEAYDTDGLQQADFAVETGTISPHAALWSGSAASFVDLHPDGYGISEAYGVLGGQQVGVASFKGNGHAILWLGSGTSFVDLNPGPNNEWGSQAFDTNGEHQVGFTASIALGRRGAARWSGTPESFLDLHAFLPSQFSGPGAQSRAMGIDEFGNIVGWAADLKDGGRQKAILWRPVPEPATGVAIAGMLTLLASRKRFTMRSRRSKSTTRRQTP